MWTSLVLLAMASIRSTSGVIDVPGYSWRQGDCPYNEVAAFNAGRAYLADECARVCTKSGECVAFTYISFTLTHVECWLKNKSCATGLENKVVAPYNMLDKKDTSVTYGLFISVPMPSKGKVVEVYTVTDLEECALRCADKVDCTAFGVDGTQSCHLINTLHSDALGRTLTAMTVYQLSG